MRVLDLFSGTHSVGNVCKELGYECISLDLKDADINCDILKWDYKQAYPPGYFDIVWSSFECTTFSNVRRCNINRKCPRLFGDIIVTEKMLDEDMMKRGLPLLRKSQEIIKYFKPNKWFMENPQSSKAKDFIEEKPTCFSYCMFGFPYRKNTNIWSNIKLKSIKCDRSHLINNKHAISLGSSGNRPSQRLQYRIPPDLIKYLFVSGN